MRKKILFILFLLLLLFSLAVFVYLNLPKFGAFPSGEDLAKVEASPNYKDGKFHNLHPTKRINEDSNFFKSVGPYLFKRYPNTRPDKPIPAIKTDLKALPAAENFVVWFGHSSYLLQIDGVRFLIDPVFTENMSPLPFGGKAFEGTDIYSASDIPDIDYLIISHDHWDHLSYETVKALNEKTKKIICGLGVASHFKRWGFDKNKIIELDWFATENLQKNVALYALPARHFSGRTLKSDSSLWMSYLVDINGYKFYIGGDSGYDDHYKKIGEKFGGVDLAFLECGQYNAAWPYVHEKPSETILAAQDLNAKYLWPVHHSKFTISIHPWNEPLKYLAGNSKGKPYRLLTPKIGQKIEIKDMANIEFEVWWE